MTDERTAFAVTWDYRCPFARNAHEHLVTALKAGAPWDVRFLAFSLGQAHVPEGGVDVWERPDEDTGLLALRAGVVVRDKFPDQFLDVHLELFAARHDHGKRLFEVDVVRDALEAGGVDSTAVLDEIETGEPLETVRREHTEFVASHDIFGVPTFVRGEDAVFVRLMNRPEGDVAGATRSIESVIGLLQEWPELNEFKHTKRKR